MAPVTVQVRNAANTVFASYGITLNLALILLIWYWIQLVVYTLYGPDLFQWLFTFASVSRPTPGWVLSTLSHGGVRHLTFNVAMLLVFGGFAEQHLRRREYLALFFVVGTTASFANLLLWPEDAPSIGASGAVYGLVAYSLYHYARNHAENLPPMATSSAGRWESNLSLLKAVSIGLGFPLIILQTLMELTGVLSSGRAAVGAHAFGFLFGVVYEYWRPFVMGRA